MEIITDNRYSIKKSFSSSGTIKKEMFKINLYHKRITDVYFFMTYEKYNFI